MKNLWTDEQRPSTPRPLAPTKTSSGGSHGHGYCNFLYHNSVLPSQPIDERPIKIEETKPVPSRLMDSFFLPTSLGWTPLRSLHSHPNPPNPKVGGTHISSGGCSMEWGLWIGSFYHYRKSLLRRLSHDYQLSHLSVVWRYPHDL